MRFALAGLVPLLLGAGCAEEASPAPHEATAAPAEAVSEAPPTGVWPDEVRPLAEAVEAFESVDACRAELRARTPTAVAEGVDDLGYEAFFDDVCAGLAAVHDGDVEGCDALSVSAARSGCRRRLALVRARPDACPEGRWGRDPLCLAWASRDRGLCVAGSTAERALCRAVFDADASACRRLRPEDQARCDGAIRRYGAILDGDGSSSEAPVLRAVFRATLETDDEETHVDREAALSRGVRLEPRGCRYRVRLEGPDDPDGDPRLPGSAEAEVSLSLTLPPTPDSTLAIGATEAVLEARVGRRDLSSVGGGGGEVRVEAFEPRRGGALRGTFSATLRAEGMATTVEGRFRTFVRDLEPLASDCGAP